MSEKRIAIPIINQAKIIRALLEYLSLKNKVLWEGTEWKSGSKTIDGIGKYQTVMVFTALSVGTALLMRRGNSLYGATPISYPAWMATAQFEITLNGDTATMTTARYLGHYANDSHRAITTTGILKIIGIDPILPGSLQEFVNSIGGGYCLSRLLGGGISALIQSLKKYNFNHKRNFKSVLLCTRQRLWRISGNPLSVQIGEFTKRYIFSFGRDISERRSFSNHERFDKCSGECRNVDSPTCTNYYELRRRLCMLGIGRNNGRRRSHCREYLQILQQHGELYRKACCNKADITVRGCAA